jgi:ATP-binding cassette subfamily C protein LapB
MTLALAAEPTPAPSSTPLLAAIARCLTLRGSPKSVGVLEAVIAPDAAADPPAVAAGLANLGLRAAWVRGRELTPDMLPAVLLDVDGKPAVIVELAAEGAAIDGSSTRIDSASLADAPVLLLQTPPARDTRADQLVEARPQGWFWPTLWSYRRYFFEAAALSAVVNLLGLAGIIFMMTVYDRILPNQAYVTLWSLAAGVVVAMLFELLSRSLRSRVLDSAGKKIDLVLGDAIFGRVLATRLEHRASSSGAFANLLKEFESVRAFVTSASLTAIADLPFALLFLLVTAIIAGPLVWVPLAAFVAVLALSLAVQAPLARLANEGLREGAVRHGAVVESLEGIETLKALRAEAGMRRKHEVSSAVIAATTVRSQAVSNLALNLTMFVQQTAGVVLLIWGVYLAAAGEVTAGALVASVQLNSRALAPLASLSALAVRFQQARSALQSLNRIMALPLEREPGRAYLSGDHWRGEIEVRGLEFGYGDDAPAALDDVSLRLRPGERVAILGRMGSGKSTLLRLLAALYRPRGGQIFLDGVEMSAIEPADLRRTLLLVGQDARLFHGTLRENLRAAAPHVDDAEMVRVATALGVAEIAAVHPLGFDRPVGERGDTLSGGQRQAVALARALLARPKVLLLDEPTAAMDQRSEAEAMKALGALPADTAILLVTHKQAVLPLVDRLIVMDRGRVVADGPKAEVLAALNEGRVKAAA